MYYAKTTTVSYITLLFIGTIIGKCLKNRQLIQFSDIVFRLSVSKKFLQL